MEEHLEPEKQFYGKSKFISFLIFPAIKEIYISK